MSDENGGLKLTDREVVILLYQLDGLGDEEAVARVFTTQSPGRISRERVIQIRSKLMSRMRRAAATGRYEPAVWDDYRRSIEG